MFLIIYVFEATEIGGAPVLFVVFLVQGLLARVYGAYRVDEVVGRLKGLIGLRKCLPRP